MKKRLLAIFIVPLLLCACNSSNTIDSSTATDTVAETSTVETTAGSMVTPASTTSAQDVKLQEHTMKATDLYAHYLDVSMQYNLIQDYNLNGIKIETIDNTSYAFTAFYDVLPVGEDFNPGNGEKQQNGWILGKATYVTFAYNEIESQRPGDASGYVKNEEPSDAIQNDELEAVAKELYTDYLTGLIKENRIELFKIHANTIMITYVEADVFEFMVQFDVLSVGGGYCAATGTPFDDGWVTCAMQYVNVEKVNGKYKIKGQGTSGAYRNIVQ